MPTLLVLDSTLYHRESGDPGGLPFVFLHGNPTSSHLWRNVLPGVAAPGRRLLAPDLYRKCLVRVNESICDPG
jgi:haloalkane dehalogenase